MSLFRRQARAQAQPNADRDLLDDLLLVRIVCAGGATRPQLVRDLGPLFANKLSPAEWRVRTETALARLANGTHLRENRGRYRISEEGAQVVASFLGEKARARAWSEQRDLWLVAKALSVDATKPSLRKALTRPEGLSALIVQQAFGLSLRRGAIALEAAYSTRARSPERAAENGKAPRKTGALSTEDSRKLAAQLLQSPRDFSTDARLIAALSAEQVGAARPEIEVLRLGLLRRLATPHAEPRREVPSPTRGRSHVSAKGLQRPGLAQFSAGVLTAARSHAEGWPGSRKAFISQVWEAIRTSHPEWGLSEIEFKDMLAGAHRAGQLVLASADLKNKRDIKEFEDSAILYKNTVWHFVRVED